jgi:OPT oligopeptide transporter protein
VLLLSRCGTRSSLCGHSCLLSSSVCPTDMLECILACWNPYISAFVFTVPIGIIAAMTNYQISTNVITKLMIGYILPGRPMAIMMFNIWGCVPTYQALGFTMDLKTGHYMKIPHRSMFFCQIVGAVVGGTVQLCVQEWMFSHVEDICSPDQRQNFICPLTRVSGSETITVSHYSCG